MPNIKSDFVTDTDNWHLDKKVPVALIGTILLQIIVFTAFIVRLDARISYLESENNRSIVEFKTLTDFDRGSEKFMARIDENMRNTNDLLNRILSKLEKESK